MACQSTLAVDGACRLGFLVFWRGSPLRDLNNELKRIDALERTLHGALADNKMPSTVYVIFEDRALLVVGPEFLELWDGVGSCDSAAGGAHCGGGKPGSQARLENILNSLRAAVAASRSGRASVQGAQMWSPQQRGIRRVVEQVLIDHEAAGGPRKRFDTVLQLAERGCPLRFGQADWCQGSGAGTQASSIIGSFVAVLGGVRDIHAQEEAALEAVCRDYSLGHHVVRMGNDAELTSKIVKDLLTAERLGVLGPALQRCREDDWEPPGVVPSALDMPAFHLVVVISSALADFVETRGAANLLVDTFLRSKAAYDRSEKVTLSVIDINGKALEIEYMKGRVLEEANAAAYLRAKAAFARSMTLESLVKKLVSPPGTPARLGFSPLLLHADELAEPLLPPQTSRRSAEPVVVVFTPKGWRDRVQQAGKKAGFTRIARAAVGGVSHGPAFLQVLLGEGLLASAIERTAGRRQVEIAVKARTQVPSSSAPQQAGSVTARTWADIARRTTGAVVVPSPTPEGRGATRSRAVAREQAKEVEPGDAGPGSEPGSATGESEPVQQDIGHASKCTQVDLPRTAEGPPRHQTSGHASGDSASVLGQVGLETDVAALAIGEEGCSRLVSAEQAVEKPGARLVSSQSYADVARRAPAFPHESDASTADASSESGDESVRLMTLREARSIEVPVSPARSADWVDEDDVEEEECEESADGARRPLFSFRWADLADEEDADQEEGAEDADGTSGLAPPVRWADLSSDDSDDEGECAENAAGSSRAAPLQTWASIVVRGRVDTVGGTHN
jgi:hypothetical protein